MRDGIAAGGSKVLDLSAAERTYRQHLPTLGTWRGWYAVVLDDRLVGVYPDVNAAILAATGLDDGGDRIVMVRRIGDNVAGKVRPN